MASPGTRVNKCYVAPISLGYDGTGNACGGLSAEDQARSRGKLNDLHEEIKAGSHTGHLHVRQCVMDWLDSLEFDPHHGHVSRPG
jgi:hypothetical protein